MSQNVSRFHNLRAGIVATKQQRVQNKGPPPHVYSAIVFEELTSSTRVYGNLQGRATQGPLT